MKTRYGSYKFMVMPFGLCNVSSTFTTSMNSIFHEKLNEYMIICIDDILVYSKIMKEHVGHLENKCFEFFLKKPTICQHGK
jgi:hypothetical protein